MQAEGDDEQCCTWWRLTVANYSGVDGASIISMSGIVQSALSGSRDQLGQESKQPHLELSEEELSLTWG